MNILGRIEAEAAFVGQLAGRPRNVLALSTVPLIQLVQLADGFRIGHPAERLCHGHEPDVIPAEGWGWGESGSQMTVMCWHWWEISIGGRGAHCSSQTWEEGKSVSKVR